MTQRLEETKRVKADENIFGERVKIPFLSTNVDKRSLEIFRMDREGHERMYEVVKRCTRRIVKKFNLLLHEFLPPRCLLQTGKLKLVPDCKTSAPDGASIYIAAGILVHIH